MSPPVTFPCLPVISLPTMGAMADASFGTQFKRARERRHLTQLEAADRLGVDRKTVDNWEHDRTYPRSRLGAIYEWAPELAEDVDPDEAELRGALQRLQERGLKDLNSAGVEAMLELYRELRSRRAHNGASTRAS